MAKNAPHPQFDHPMLACEEDFLYLHFDSPWAQGVMDANDPKRLVFQYTQQMCAWLLFLAPQPTQPIGILGLGAGAFVRYFQAYTKSPLSIVEWNPLVTQCCQQCFKLKLKKHDHLFHENAQTWIQIQHNRYQALMIDLYDYAAQGPVCSSLAFYQACYRALSQVGIASINLFGHHASFEKNKKNIQKAFNNRVIFFEETADGNKIALAFKGPPLTVTRQALLARAQYVQDHYDLPTLDFVQNLFGDQSQITI